MITQTEPGGGHTASTGEPRDPTDEALANIPAILRESTGDYEVICVPSAPGGEFALLLFDTAMDISH